MSCTHAVFAISNEYRWTTVWIILCTYLLIYISDSTYINTTITNYWEALKKLFMFFFIPSSGKVKNIKNCLLVPDIFITNIHTNIIHIYSIWARELWFNLL